LARTGADRHQAGQTRWKFLTWCADSDIPEVRRLAVTVDRWWPEIAAFIDTGHSNAKSEGINRVIKLVARNAFGFRNGALNSRRSPGRAASGHTPGNGSESDRSTWSAPASSRSSTL
ncbi:transposase, partial [Streptomyces nodosus]|uniref:transposase n=1 Tax=Streptomyces nodosus TaxID=40318 RepID=UPI003451F5E5